MTPFKVIGVELIHTRAGVAQGSLFKPCGFSRSLSATGQEDQPDATKWKNRRVTNRTLRAAGVTSRTVRYSKSMSRLRRLQVTGKTFVSTCNVLPVRTQLTVVRLLLLPTSSYDDAVAVGCKLF